MTGELNYYIKQEKFCQLVTRRYFEYIPTISGNRNKIKEGLFERIFSQLRISKQK